MAIKDERGAEAKRAHNQTIFRETNEEIRAVVEGAAVVFPEAPFVCECSDEECRLLLSVPLDVYSRVRESPRRFIHARAHQDDGTSGEAVELFDGFVVMEKEGVAADVAEQRAP